MKELLVILAALMTSVAAQDIQHAPTADQCRADWRLWNYQDQQSGAFSDLSLQQLHARSSEMESCTTVDRDYKPHYWNMSNEFLNETGMRADHFIARHGLRQQFVDEDAKGAR